MIDHDFLDARGFLGAPPHRCVLTHSGQETPNKERYSPSLGGPGRHPSPSSSESAQGSTSNIDTAFAGSHSGATSLSSSTFKSRGAPANAPRAATARRDTSRRNQPAPRWICVVATGNSASMPFQDAVSYTHLTLPTILRV